MVASGKVKRPGLAGAARQSRLPARRRRHRCSTPGASCRSTDSRAASRRGRCARPSAAAWTASAAIRSTCRRTSRPGHPSIGAAIDGGPLPGRLRAARRGRAAARPRRAAGPPGGHGRRAGASGASRRPSGHRGQRRRGRRRCGRPSRPACRRRVGRARRADRRPAACHGRGPRGRGRERAHAAPHPGRRRLGQDGRGGLGPGAGRASTAGRPRCWRPPTCWRASSPAPWARCWRSAGIARHAADGLAQRRGAPRRRWRPSPPGRRPVVVGTHALLQESRRVSRACDLVVVDEQHRFGVAQREALAAKGESPARPAHDRHAHPAHAGPGALRGPRRLRPARRAGRPRPGPGPASGDPLDLGGRPGSRSAQEAAAGHRTLRRRAAHRPAGLRRGRRRGRRRRDRRCRSRSRRRAAWPPPRARRRWPRASRALLAPLRVGLVHGRLRADERDAEMARFRDGELDVLVGTTVVEVGVDVPEATMMIVLDADRFGLVPAPPAARPRRPRRAPSRTASLVADVPDGAAWRCGPPGGRARHDRWLRAGGAGLGSCAARARCWASRRAACRRCALASLARSRRTRRWPWSAAPWPRRCSTTDGRLPPEHAAFGARAGRGLAGRRGGRRGRQRRGVELDA